MHHLPKGLLAFLQHHGLDDRSARIYLTVLQEGPLTAREVAWRTGLHRVEAYRRIQDLRREGLVEATGKPLRFSALPLPKLLDRWEKDVHERLHHLQSSRAELLEALTRFPLQGDSSQVRQVQLSEGTSRVNESFLKAFAQARRSIDCCIDASIGPRDGRMRSRLRAITAARRRGVAIRGIIEAVPETVAAVHLGLKLGSMRYVDSLRTGRFYLVDGEAVLVAHSVPSGDAFEEFPELAIWTNAPEVVRFYQRAFDHLYAQGRPVEQWLDRVEAGPAHRVRIDFSGPRKDASPFPDVARRWMAAWGIDGAELDLTPNWQELGRAVGDRWRGGARGLEPTRALETLGEALGRAGQGRLHWGGKDPLRVFWTGCRTCAGAHLPVGQTVCQEALRHALQQSLGPGYTVGVIPRPPGRRQNVHGVEVRRTRA